MSSRASPLVLPLAPLLVLGGGCFAMPADSTSPPISVVTQDLGLGGDLHAVLAAAPADQPALADGLWAEVGTATFSRRAEAIAAAIEERHPDVVGVQSAMQLRRTAPASGAEEVVADYLDLLVAALGSRGVSYVPVAATTSTDLTLTGAAGDLYRVIDREAILVRAGVPASGVTGGTFVARRLVSMGGVLVPYPRGWASAQVEVGGRSFRLVTAHLDAVDPAVQSAQATELLRVAGPGPVIIVGGFGPDQDPAWAGYGILASPESGFEDAAAAAGAGIPNCCRDQACVDPAAVFDRRTDFVLMSREFRAFTGSRVPGNGGAMANGLWPSPHAGVVAQIRVKE
ncbi:MAG TPA: hypothetical protein VFL83_19215 [Anaeromyxobacter sp.]|nr:hypothetical protein [Anaeromyxobacter sp.]